jgi:hypothetical protein
MRPARAVPSISDGASNHAVAAPSTIRQSVPTVSCPALENPFRTVWGRLPRSARQNEQREPDSESLGSPLLSDGSLMATYWFTIEERFRLR